MNEQTIICPNCGKRIPITQALTSQIESGLRKNLESELKEREKKAKIDFDKMLAAEKARIEEQAIKQAEGASARKLAELRSEVVEAMKREKGARAEFDQRLTKERGRLEKLARQKAESQYAGQLDGLQKRLKEREKEAAEIRKRELDLQRQEADFVAQKKTMEIEIQKKTEQAVRKAEQETAEKLEDEYRSREMELEKKLSDAKKQASELKRKLDQGSQQSQGEVAELALENVLAKAFPDDEIQPVRKGKLGADILQRVYDANKQLCGTIIWETKNVKDWQKSWLPKLRNDQRRAKAHLAILVSRVLPKDVAHFAQIEGVWVTDYPLALGVGTALRLNLIQISTMKQALEGKHDKEKVEQLFSYLSGPEFKGRVEAIVEAFRTLQDDLDKEKSVIEKYWAKRQKQLELVIQNISGMYGELQIIVGPSLPRIRRLELPST